MNNLSSLLNHWLPWSLTLACAPLGSIRKGVCAARISVHLLNIRLCILRLLQPSVMTLRGLLRLSCIQSLAIVALLIGTSVCFMMSRWIHLHQHLHTAWTKTGETIWTQVAVICRWLTALPNLCKIWQNHCHQAGHMLRWDQLTNEECLIEAEPKKEGGYAGWQRKALWGF